MISVGNTIPVPATSGAVMRRTTDLLSVALIVVFGAWAAAAPTWPRLDILFDHGFFVIAGLAVSAFQWRVVSRLPAGRSRLAWRLLAAASLVRIVSGQVWSLWVQAQGGAARPPLLLFFNASSLVLGMAGLLAFFFERREAVDRTRLTIDATIVVVGSAVVMWFIALGPLFGAVGPRAARFEDYVFTISDVASATIAAVLFLRSGTRFMRTVAALLLGAHLLQVVPDILFWLNKVSFSYRPGDALAVVWVLVWVFKGLAARYAEHALTSVTSDALRVDAEYDSGLVPHFFVIAATAVLLLGLTTKASGQSVGYVLAAATMAILLVVREVVEIRERERLRVLRRDEADWYGALLRSAYDFVMLLDTDGRTLHASPVTEDVINDASALQRPWGLLDIGHPDDQPELRAALAGSSTAATTADLRYRIRSTGDAEWHELALRVDDRRDDPLVRAYVLNGHDVTRESRLSGRLRQSQELDALGVFAGGLAHDLNNILTVIDAHAELLLEDVPPEHVIRADLTAIRAASARAHRLTRGLLALSRRKVATSGILDLPSLLRGRIAAAALTDRVVLTLPVSLPSVRVDPTALMLAIDALLWNELDTSDDANVISITVSTTLVSGASAVALEVVEGAYVSLTIHSSRSTNPPPTRDARKTWESAPDELMMLMARAAVREAGGAVRSSLSADGSVVMYVPTAGVT